MTGRAVTWIAFGDTIRTAARQSRFLSCSVVGVCKRTVGTLIADGELSPVRIRSLRRLELSEIWSYCRRNLQ